MRRIWWQPSKPVEASMRNTGLLEAPITPCLAECLVSTFILKFLITRVSGTSGTTTQLSSLWHLVCIPRAKCAEQERVSGCSRRRPGGGGGHPTRLLSSGSSLRGRQTPADDILQPAIRNHPAIRFFSSTRPGQLFFFISEIGYDTVR